MSDPLLTAALTTGVSTIVNKGLSFIPEAARKISEKIGEGKIVNKEAYGNYLKRLIQKHGYVKTLLYKNEPKNIEDFFVIPTIREGNLVFSAKELIDSIDSRPSCLLMEGSGGLGKSTVLRYFLIQIAKKGEYIPVYVELRKLNDAERGFPALIKHSLDLFNDRVFVDDDSYQKALSTGNMLFLLDGFDEIMDEKREGSLRDINEFMDLHYGNKFILTCRDGIPPELFQRFSLIKLCPLGKDQIEKFIKRAPFDSESAKKKFLRLLNVRLMSEYSDFVSNPLLLSMMLITYEQEGEIPQRNGCSFFEKAFDALYNRHDFVKDGFKRVFHSKMPREQFEEIFSRFCLKSYARELFEFGEADIRKLLREVSRNLQISIDIDAYIKDLVESVCMLIIDDGKYSFSHRSFQEYFAARAIEPEDDTTQCLVCADLLDKLKHRIDTDDMFPMLKSLSGVRYEKNVITPILKEFNIEKITLKELIKLFLDQNVIAVAKIEYPDQHKTLYIHSTRISARWVLLLQETTIYENVNLGAPDGVLHGLRDAITTLPNSYVIHNGSFEGREYEVKRLTYDSSKLIEDVFIRSRLYGALEEIASSDTTQSNTSFSDLL